MYVRIPTYLPLLPASPCLSPPSRQGSKLIITKQSITTRHRCSSPGTRRTSALSSGNGGSPTARPSCCPCLASSSSRRGTSWFGSSRGGTRLPARRRWSSFHVSAICLYLPIHRFILFAGFPSPFPLAGQG